MILTLIAETPRLILRQFTPEDLEPLAEILGDPEVMRFSVAGAKTREETGTALERTLDSYGAHGYGLFAVVRKEDDALIGYCGLLRQMVDDHFEIEICCRLARACWGQGYATEAARAVMTHAVGDLGLRRLIAIIEAENAASVRVAEKLGMHPERETTCCGFPVTVYTLTAAEGTGGNC